MRVLATGTSSFFAARLIQGFGELGVPVTAADGRFWSGSKSLPNVTRRLNVPSPNRDPERYLDLIERELQHQHYDLLLPTFEEGLLFAQQADVLRQRVKLLIPPFATMWQLHHKPSLHQFCTRVGLPSPRTFTPQSNDELTALLGELRYPVVLKPPAGNNSVGRVFCETAEDLQREFQQHAAVCHNVAAEPPLVQEKIIGQPIYTLMLCDAGRKVAEVIYRPLRTFPDDGGTSVIRESIAHPEIAEITETIARRSRTPEAQTERMRSHQTKCGKRTLHMSRRRGGAQKNGRKQNRQEKSKGTHQCAESHVSARTLLFLQRKHPRNAGHDYCRKPCCSRERRKNTKRNQKSAHPCFFLGCQKNPERNQKPQSHLIRPAENTLSSPYAACFELLERGERTVRIVERMMVGVSKPKEETVREKHRKKSIHRKNRS